MTTFVKPTMTTNTVFFSQEAVNQWMIEGAVQLDNNELVKVPDGQRYELIEAFRIVREVSGAEDENALVGKVKGRALLEGLGAELTEASMLLGDNAYDVVAGWFGILVDDREPAIHARSPAASGDTSKEDAALLTRFLLQRLN